MKTHSRVSLQTQLLALFTLLTVIAAALVAAPTAHAQEKPIAPGGQIAPNPELPEKCGLSMALVFDVSGSIGEQGLIGTKEAGTAVVEALKDTPTQIGIYSFASAAPADNLTNLDKTPASEQDTLIGAIESLKVPPGGRRQTNWDKGLKQVQGKGYDVVYFITDGKPNRYGNDQRGLTRSVQDAVKSANAIKGEGTRVVPLAVGEEVKPGSIPATYLNYISGEGQWIPVSNYSELSAALVEQATKGCRGEVTVEKSFVNRSGKPVEPSEETAKGGWTFKIKSTQPKEGTTITAIEEEVTTDADGKAKLGYVTSNPDAEGTVTIEETNGTLKGVECTAEDGTTIEVEAKNNTFTVPAKTGLKVNCTAKNLDPKTPGLSSGSGNPDGSSGSSGSSKDPDGSGSSVPDTCIPAVGGIFAVVLLAIPLMMLSHVKVPGLQGLHGHLGQQIQNANNELQRGLGIQNDRASQLAAQVDNHLKALGANASDLVGGLAAVVGLLAAVGTIVAFCVPRPRGSEPL